MTDHDPKPPAPPIPQPISWPDEKTAPVAVPFELLEQCLQPEARAKTATPFDGVPAAEGSTVATPSRGFGAESTGKFGLDDLLSATGDVLLLGDPFDVASTAVVSTTSSDSSGEEVVSTTSILVGRDIERLLGPSVVLAPNPARPAVELSAFEQFAFSQLDGKRSIEAVATATGISTGDLRIALALLADKDQLVALTPAPASSSKPASERSPWDVPSTGSRTTTVVSRTFAPITVLRRIDGVAAEGLSALESFVLAQVDGRRSVQQLREQMGLSTSDLALALELLQRRGLVERGGQLPRSPPAPVVMPTATTTAATAATTTTATTTTTTTTTAPPPRQAALAALLTEAERNEARGDLAGAVACLQQAVRLDTRDAAVWNRLGTSLVRQHDLPAALAALNMALSLSPNDPTIVSNQKRVVLLASQVVRSTGKR